jgi:hypothetical protein
MPIDSLKISMRSHGTFATPASTCLTDRVEWKSFGFEFKPGKLVFGEYIAQGRIRTW